MFWNNEILNAMQSEQRLVSSKLNDLDKRTARIGKEVREARTIADIAKTGHTEFYATLKAVNKLTERNEKRIDDLINLVRKNTRWQIGVIIGFVLSLSSFVLKLFLK